MFDAKWFDLAVRANLRQQRLFFCACSRCSWNLLDDLNRSAVLLAEQYADGCCSWHQLEPVHTAVLRQEVNFDNGSVASMLDLAKLDVQDATKADAELKEDWELPLFSFVDTGPPDEAIVAPRRAVLHHIVGSSTHSSLKAPPSWPASVVQLAQAAYDQQPVTFALHDALLEAGQVELAEHFKESYHPKGCWILDMILEKH